MHDVPGMDSLMKLADRPPHEQGPTGRHVLCLACETQLALAADTVRCACGRTTAWPDDDGDGFSYLGPAVSACSMTVHEPEHRRMARRSIRMADDERVHRVSPDTPL